MKKLITLMMITALLAAVNHTAQASWNGWLSPQKSTVAIFAVGATALLYWAYKSYTKAPSVSLTPRKGALNTRNSTPSSASPPASTPATPASTPVTAATQHYGQRIGTRTPLQQALDLMPPLTEASRQLKADAAKK